MKFDPKSVRFPIRQLRQPIALNLFKIHLLGEGHVPAQAQTEQVLTALAMIGLDDAFDQRTWAGWFGENARRARGDSVTTLDKVATGFRLINLQQDSLSHLQCPQFFSKMIDGGLCKEVLEPTASKKPKYTLLQKADEYLPCTQWHLHLDAIEAVALAEPNGEVDWETVKGIAAHRVSNILHTLWNPRGGTIYPFLSSNFEIEWNNSTPSEQESIKKNCARFKPNPFSRWMNMPATPEWSRLQVGEDIGSNQVHMLLLAMAADVKFLVADRLEAWSLDLATAALAMYARALTDRYTTFGHRVGPEFLYWDAFELLFFREDVSEESVIDSLIRALESTGADFSIQSIEVLFKARYQYRSALSKLGVSLDYISGLISRCWTMHPLIYRGGPPPDKT